jgi:hypothetical protein
MPERRDIAGQTLFIAHKKTRRLFKTRQVSQCRAPNDGTAI